MQLSLVDDTDSLAFGPCDGLGRHQVDLRADAEHRAHCGVEGTLARLYVRDLIRELLGREFDVDVECVGVVLAIHDDLVVGSVAFLEEHCLDLAREHVDAADDHHVVASAHRLAHLDVRSAAGALFARQHADIARSVAEKRERLLVERGEYQLSLCAVGKRLACVGIDDLGVEVVLVDATPGPLISVRP